MGSSGRGVQLSPVSTNFFRDASGIPFPVRTNGKNEPMNRFRELALRSRPPSPRVPSLNRLQRLFLRN